MIPKSGYGFRKKDHAQNKKLERDDDSKKSHPALAAAGECSEVSREVHPMLPIPADIFTEPDNVAPDDLANLGPLRRLAGVWQADKGVDINPKAQGPERRIFREHIRMDAIDPQTNGPQLFYGLRYHVHINTPEEDITFHDQVGY